MCYIYRHGLPRCRLACRRAKRTVVAQALPSQRAEVPTLRCAPIAGASVPPHAPLSGNGLSLPWVSGTLQRLQRHDLSSPAAAPLSGGDAVARRLQGRADRRAGARVESAALNGAGAAPATPTKRPRHAARHAVAPRPTRCSRTRGGKGEKHADPADPPRRRANKRRGHGLIRTTARRWSAQSGAAAAKSDCA
jgi:hypothetical protein